MEHKGWMWPLQDEVTIGEITETSQMLQKYIQRTYLVLWEKYRFNVKLKSVLGDNIPWITIFPT